MAESSASLLRLNDDILFHLCKTISRAQPEYNPIYSPLKSLSTTCKRLRAIATSELFRRISVGNGILNGTYFSARLNSMQRCPSIIRCTREFALVPDGCVASACTNDMGSLIFARLADFLHSLQNLESLQVEDYHSLWHQKSALEDNNMRFPSLKILKVMSTQTFLPPLCENVQTLIVDANSFGRSNFENMIQVSSGLRHIRHLHLKAPWKIDYLQQVLESFPNLQTLGMACTREGFKTPLPVLAATLAQFRELRLLMTAESHQLSMGYRPPMCGNSYMRPGGARLRESVKQQREDVSKSAAYVVFQSCSQVEQVWIGKKMRAKAIKSSNGAIQNVILQADIMPSLLSMARTKWKPVT